MQKSFCRCFIEENHGVQKCSKIEKFQKYNLYTRPQDRFKEAIGFGKRIHYIQNFML